MAMIAVLAEHELFESCRVLFGAELQVSRSFLEYLQRPGIKSAYRQKALTTHPDILASQGDMAKQHGTDLFQVVQQAYEHLTTYLDARDSGFRFQAPRSIRPQHSAPVKAKPSPPPTSRPQPRAWSRSTPATDQTCARRDTAFTRQPGRPTSAWQTTEAWTAPTMPTRKLLFGHYLYYAGATNWQTIIKALVWQRTGRPRLGEIGRCFGWLTDHNILTILKQRKLSEPFGSSAVALGLLTNPQLRLLIFQQNKLQRKFGDYFIQHNLLSPLQVSKLVTQFIRHNTTYAPQRFAYSSRM